MRLQRVNKVATRLGVVNPPVMFHTSVNSPRNNDVVLMSLLKRPGKVRSLDIVVKGFQGSKETPAYIVCSYTEEKSGVAVSHQTELREGVNRVEARPEFGADTLFVATLKTDLLDYVCDTIALVLDVEYDLTGRDIARVEIPKEIE